MATHCDRERLVKFDTIGFGLRVTDEIRGQCYSINRLSEESLVPYQTVWRLTQAGESVLNIEAIWSVAKVLGFDPLPYIAD